VSGITVIVQPGGKFPDWFVANCPPDDAQDASGTVYRFVAAIPVDPDEFRSDHETGERPNGPPCQRCGLSVFQSVDDVRRLLRFLWKNYPGRAFGPHVVKRDLVPEDGKTALTGGHGHHTWWAYEGVEWHARFEFVESVPRK
jgi:hypothetical protein